MTPTSEILNKAADIIETRGWSPGNWGFDGGGLCLEGGIAVAAGLGDVAIGPMLLRDCPAARAVHTYLQLAEDEDLWEWNDRSLSYCDRTGEPFYGPVRRTASEVIEVLRATALIEQARENSSVTEKVSA